nr:spore cortex biosynthesis protein YabQ [uncultured Bacillus sp.]
MTLSTQFATMLAMISMGVFFGAVLDTYNRFLQRRKRKSWIVFFNDILFMAVQGLLVFYALFQVNQGELRFYIFIALFCGFAAYQGLFKQWYLKCLEKMIKFCIFVLRSLVRLINLLIYKPIYILITTVIAIIISLGKGLFAAVIWLLKCVLFILKMILKPLQWLLLLFWKFIPKSFKKTVEKLYNKLAGKLVSLKNYYHTWKNK